MSHIFIMVLLCATALCQQIAFPDVPSSNLDDVEAGEQVVKSEDDIYNLWIDEQLTVLTKQLFAEVIYGKKELGEHIQLNRGGLYIPYDWESGYYEYTGLERLTPAPEGGKKLLLERNSDTPQTTTRINLLETLPAWEKLPDIVREYMRLLEENDGECSDLHYGWLDKLQHDCDWYADNNQCESAIVGQLRPDGQGNATHVCCVCGGGVAPQPETEPPQQPFDCVDFPSGWTDKIGKDCSWYKNEAQCGKAVVTQLANGGYNGDTACCECGGGDRSEPIDPVDPVDGTCADSEEFVDILSQTCADYTISKCALANTFVGAGETSALEACCLCSTETCENVPGFLDSIGLGCDAYNLIPSLCLISGRTPNGAGIAAIDACCVCEGTENVCDPPNVASSNSLTACEFVEDGKSCEFECNSGYDLVGSLPIRCINRAWDSLPECHLKSCDPPEIANSNAFAECGLITEGQFCFFQCQPFTKHTATAGGDFYPQCVNLQWTTLPRCELQDFCSVPAIAHSNANEACKNVLKNEFCLYDCEDGYMSIGDPLECLLIGHNTVWTTLPECIPIARCPKPPITDAADDDLDNGCTGLLPGFACFFNCDTGYQFGGTLFPTCQVGGVWDIKELDDATCDPIVTCDDPGVLRSTSSDCANTNPNYKCQFACDDGYRMDGEFPLCLPDGFWDHIPTCVEIPTCAAYPIINSVSGCEAVEEDEFCSYDCSNGFVQRGDHPQCQTKDGSLQWIFDQEPECVPEVHCFTPSIINGVVNCNLPLAGQSCPIICSDGFDLNGQHPVCQDSGNYDILPTCKLKTGCDAPSIPNSNVDETCPLTVNAGICSFSCDEGYELSSQIPLICFNGVWQTSIPSCERDEPCLSPVIHNSDVSTSCQELEHGSLCLFLCNDGFKKVGADLVCNDGVWEPEDYEDSCEAFEYCPPFPVPHSLTETLCDDKEEDDFCVFECADNYERSGDFPECQRDGDELDWNIVDANNPPACHLIPICIALNVPNSDAEDACSVKEEGEWCTFKCNQGYHRLGQYPRCMAVGEELEWTTVDPDAGYSCEKIVRCTLPNIPEAIQDRLAECDGSDIDAICEVFCKDGWELPPNTLFPTCGDDGEWSGITQCVEIHYCPTKDNANGEACIDVRENEACEFNCITGYELHGAFQTCVAIGGSDTELQYIGEAPTCEEKTTCVFGPSVTNSDSGKCAGYAVGLECDLKCNEGLELIGDIPICRFGEWRTSDDKSKNKLPECRLITPIDKINFLDRQIFTDQKLTFYDRYKEALQKLEVRLPTETEQDEIAANESDIVSLTDDLVAEIDRCQDLFNRNIFSKYDTWEELCSGIGTWDAIQARISLLQGRNFDLEHDDVNELRERIDAFEERQEYGTAVRGGDNDIIYVPNWFTTPSPKVTFDNLNSITDGGATYNFSFSISKSEAVSEYEKKIEETKTVTNVGTTSFIAITTNTSEFKRFEFTEETTTIEMYMRFLKWGPVTVRPDGWYSDTWPIIAQVAENGGRIDEAYTTWCDDNNSTDNPCNGKFPLLGRNGFIHDKMTELFVGTHVEMYASWSQTTRQRIEEFLAEASSVRFGPLCTGAACHTIGNVILGGDDLTDHGYYSGGNKQGWKYMELALASLMKNTWRTTSTLGTIAALGSSNPGGINNYDAGSAILSAANANSLTVWWYNGDTAIQQFFDDLASGAKDPQIIWIAGNGAGNDIDSAEGTVLTANSKAIDAFTDSGGGLLAHGSGSQAYGWLFDLLPGIQENLGCDYSRAYLSAAGREKFPTLTDNDVRAGPCHSHFTGDFGNLETLAFDTQDKPYIIGGYGAITRKDRDAVPVNFTTDITQEDPHSFTVEAIFPRPSIIAIYSPPVGVET